MSRIKNVQFTLVTEPVFEDSFTYRENAEE